jgi:hypothetical protein
MKKIYVLVAVVLMMATSSFAAQVPSSGGSLSLGTGTNPKLSMGLSSNVSAVYEDGGAIKPQWYAIATSHLGGKQVYGTAQDVTNLYKLADEKTPGVAATFDGMPADSTASSSWSSGVWVKM